MAALLKIFKGQGIKYRIKIGSNIRSKVSWFRIKSNIKIGSNIRSPTFWDGAGDGAGWGGACVTVPWKENRTTSRHVKRYGDGKGMGMGWGVCYRDISRQVQRYGAGDGAGRGMCYRSKEGEHRHFHTRRTQAMGWGLGWGGVRHVLPLHQRNTRTSRHAKRYGDGDGDGAGWGMCYRHIQQAHKD